MQTSESYPKVNMLSWILFPVRFNDFAEIPCKKPPCKQGRVKRRIKVFGLRVALQGDLKTGERVGTVNSLEDKGVGMS